MRILITGATGFIGRHLVPILTRHQLLLLGRREACFSQEGVSYIRADLADLTSWRKQVEDFTPDACIHLAWKGLPDYSFKSCLENYNISARLYEFLSSNGCRKIFTAGTCWEYGNLQGVVKEDDFCRELSLFASFKAGLRLIGESLSLQQEVDFIWGRIFFVYGQGQRETSLIPSYYSSIAGGQLPIVKNPNSACDFVHVSDVVSAIKALIETEGVRGIFNIGSGYPTEVSRVCEYVAKTLKAEKKIFCDSTSSAGDGLWADISLITGKTGWEPQMPVHRGVEETVKELRKDDGGS
jgi:nucleoside-diphosphate-sugar epimerase